MGLTLLESIFITINIVLVSITIYNIYVIEIIKLENKFMRYDIKFLKNRIREKNE